MKKTLMNLAALAVAGSFAVPAPAYAWVPFVDDIKKAAEDVQRELGNGAKTVAKGAAALGCGYVAGQATGDPVATAAAAGACADAVK